MLIKKADGEKVRYSRGKFCSSLKGAGAEATLVDSVCQSVEKGLRPGQTTDYIFRRATRELMKKNLKVAARYNMKRGVRELGPAGFLFEQYVETILKTLGYRTARNRNIRGKCTSHEIDVTGTKGGKQHLIEAKYHSLPGTKVHIDVVMYADARCGDIARKHTKNNYTMWLITNTKFTTKAREYAKCRGIQLTGWDCPRGEGLEKIITEHMLYPVTSLPSVTKEVREVFVKKGMMLAQDLAPYSAKELERKFSLPREKAEAIAKEADALVYGD